jgi:glutathione S-transferase
MFGEAGLAAYGNPLVATRYMAPDDQKQNWTVDYLKGAIIKRLRFVGRAPWATNPTSPPIASPRPISRSPTSSAARSSPASKRHSRLIAAYYERLRAAPRFQRAAAVK